MPCMLALCVQDFLEDCSSSADDILAAEGQYRDWVADSDTRNNTDTAASALTSTGYDASKKRSSLEMTQVCCCCLLLRVFLGFVKFCCDVQPVSKQARTEEPAAPSQPSTSPAAPAGYDYSAYYQQYYGAAAAAYGAYPGYMPQ